MKHRRDTWTVGCVVAMATCTTVMNAVELPPVEGNVIDVTLYRGQALVTRSVPLVGEAGPIELKVINLPRQVVADSLFAEGGNGIEIRAVRYRTQAVGEEPQEEIRKLDSEVEVLEDKILRNTKLQDLSSQRLAYLDKLEGFTASTGVKDLSKGLLNAEALREVTLFGFDQRKQAVDASLTLATEARELKKKLSLLKRKRGELTGAATRTAREALIFLEKRDGADEEVKLSYLVGEAGWSPAYNFRAHTGLEEVTIEYQAIIQQMSGEDWNGVHLTLSTASPGLSAEGPGLAPFRVTMSTELTQMPRAQQDLAERYNGYQNQLLVAEQQQRKAQLLVDNRSFNFDMNVAANSAQAVELVVDENALRVMQIEAPLSTDGPSVNYELTGPVSLASRADQQMLRISKTEVAGSFYHVATPVLTTYVYREVELINTGAEVLLAGSVSVYLNGRLVGRGEIPTVARGETFVMGFGADPQLRAHRELVKKTESTQGGNRELSFHYRLTLDNFEDTDITVRLLDRLPISERESDLRVTLDTLDHGLSQDQAYLRVERPKGILRWDVDVPAGAAGERARIVEYDFRLEFDRNLNLTTQETKEEMRQEFERLRDKRFRR